MKHRTCSFLLLSAALVWVGCSGDLSPHPALEPVGLDDPDLLAVHDHGEIRVTDLDRYLVSLPPARRQPGEKGEEGFKRWIHQRVDDLFVVQTLTAPAMLEEVEQDKAFQRGWPAQRGKILAQGYLQGIETEAVSLDEARRYYDTHRDEFAAPERRLVHNLLLAFPEGASAENKAAICQQAKQLRDQLLAGASFEEMALRYSSSSTAATGGLIGDITKDQLRGDAAELIFSLQPGIVSKVLRNAAGCQLFLVVNVTPAVNNSFETIGSRILEQLTRQRVAERTDEEAQEVAASFGIEIPRWPPADFDPADGQRVVFELGDEQITVRDVLARSQQAPPPLVYRQLVHQRLFSAAMERDNAETAAQLETAAKRNLATTLQQRRLLNAHLEAIPTETFESYYAEHKDQFQSQTQVECSLYSWAIEAGDPLRSLARPRAFIRAIAEHGKEAAVEEFAEDPGLQTEAIPLSGLRGLLAQRRDLARALLHELEEGKVIGPYRSGNRVLVLVVESLVAARPLSFSESYDQVVADYAAQKAAALRQDWLESFKREHHFRLSEANLAQFGERLVESLRSVGAQGSAEVTDSSSAEM